MQSFPCEAIILGMKDYRESDKLVTLFTPEHGKVSGLARGAKRSARRFGGTLELFARLRVQLVLRQGLSTVQEADAVTVYPGIRADLLKIGCASYACEIVDCLAPEGMANERLFRLLAAYLERLDQAPAALSDRRFFEINLLNIMGYRPALDHCSACGVNVPAGAADRILCPDGSLTCRECGYGAKISAVTVLYLDRALRTGRFGVVTFPPEELREAGNLLDSAIGAHMGRPLKSLAFLREMAELSVDQG